MINKKKTTSMILCGMLALSNVAFAAGSGGFDESFDANLGKWKVGGSSKNICITEDPTDSSNKVLGVKLTESDSKSARVMYYNCASNGDTMQYSWKFMIDPDHSSNGGWETIGLFPSKSGKSAPNVGIEYKNGKAVVFMYDSKTGKYTDSSSVSVPKGEWVDLELEVKWATDGYVKASIDGQDATDGKMSGSTVADESGNFLELGVVKESNAGNSMVYFDDVKIKPVSTATTAAKSSTTSTTTSTKSYTSKYSSSKTRPSKSTSTTTTPSTSTTTTPSTSTSTTTTTKPTTSTTTTPSTSTSTTTTTKPTTSTTTTPTTTTPSTSTSTTTSNTTTGTIVSKGTPEFFYETFASGNFNQWDALENANGQSGTIVADPTNSSNKVFKAYTWAGNDKSIRPRAELRVNNGEELDQEYWYSWKFMIDPSTNHNSATEILGQWHTQPDASKGETWSNWTDGSFALALEIRPDGQLDFASTPMGITMLKSGIYPEKGKWHTITWHIKHSTSNQGFVEAWVDGKSLIPQGKIYGKTSYNNAGSYLKIGSYRYNYTSWSNPGTYASGTSTVYYDDVKISQNKANVDGAPQ